MPRQLVNLRVHNVSAVDRAANKRTFLMMKAEVNKDDAMTFDDAMFGNRLHKVYIALGERYGALMETIDSIRRSDESEKGQAVKDALTAFVGSMEKSIPALMAEMDVTDEALEEELEKAGRKISADRMAKLKTLMKTLNDIINEQEGEAMTEKKAPDATALQKMVSGMAAMFGKMMGADEATITSLETASKGEVAPVIPEVVASRLSKAETENAELKTRLEKAEQATSALREEAELRKFAEQVAGFKNLGLDPEKDAALFKSVSEKLPKEQSERFLEIFRAAAAQANVAKMFGEVGSAGLGNTAGSAAEEIEQKVDAIIVKNAGMDRTKARDQVFRENGALYEKWRAETTVKV